VFVVQTIANEEVTSPFPRLRSPTETRNGLHLCVHCDDPFERHFLDVLPDGAIRVVKSSEWFIQLRGAVRRKYTGLDGKKVYWADRIGKGAYPSAAILEWRLGLPYVKSAEGRERIKHFYDTAVKLNRKAPIAPEKIFSELAKEESAGRARGKRRRSDVRKRLLPALNAVREEKAEEEEEDDDEDDDEEDDEEDDEPYTKRRKREGGANGAAAAAAPSAVFCDCTDGCSKGSRSRPGNCPCRLAGQSCQARCHSRAAAAAAAAIGCCNG
jgi:hypothetical protein